jgi:hypothetical protein
MTTQRKVLFWILPFQSYSVLSLLGLVACRAAYGHADGRLLIMFLAWSSIASSFLWLVGAAVQAHFRFIERACVNAALAIAAIFAAAHLMPYLAREPGHRVTVAIEASRGPGR